MKTCKKNIFLTKVFFNFIFVFFLFSCQDKEESLNKNIIDTLDLVQAGEYNNLENFLKENKNFNINQNINGFFLTEYAIYKNDLATLETLIKNGAKIDLIDKLNRTPIDYAIEENKINILKYFLSKDSLVNLSLKQKNKIQDFVSNSL